MYHYYNLRARWRARAIARLSRESLFLMYFPGMKLGSKIFSFIDIFMATYQRSPKTETAGPPGERVQPFAIPAHP